MMRHPLSLIPLCLLALNTAEAAEPGDATATRLDEVTVTGTREKQSLAETPASVGIVKDAEIRAVRPTHPSQIMGQIPGVWVNVTGGEGHQTAIRQPLTTSPVYLYLEDGIPTRSTGFFNHNALYEVNVPQAGGIEVNKGPGTALYGSDAVGGVINVLTRPAPLKPEAELMAEAGGYGWKRLLATGGNTSGNDGWRTDLNLTATNGWREHTAYDRQSGTVRWDRALDDNTAVKTVITFSSIDQETAGASTISQSDYENNPTISYTPISFRTVEAFRVSAAYEKEMGDSLLSITPYFRNNGMDYIANWSLGYDPTLLNTSNQSFGVMAKYRKDFAPYRTRLIAGVDIDRSPGSKLEKYIVTSTTGSGYTTRYIGYTEGATVYDYDVTYQGVSPYLHGEMSPNDSVRVTAGLRYDDVSYSYHNNLADTAIGVTPSRFYGHVGDTSVDFGHVSPKLGVTMAFTPEVSGFAAYNHAFRAPSEGQLFRPAAGNSANNAQATAQSAVGLKPIKVDSHEIGLRGKSSAVNYEISVYHMTKTDDIVSFQATSADPRVVQNAGKTLHKGVEMGLGADMAREWRLDMGYSYATHTYEDWVNNTANYSGKEMEAAPRTIANTRLSYRPAALNGGRVTLEWVKLGSYWIDAINTIQYSGHDLLNLRANYPVNREWEMFGSVTNLTDKRYADSTSFATVSGTNIATYAPGMPRTFYAGMRYNWHE
ncbi:MAG: TonB-dependent receptor [Pseudomonadota bacterium]